MLAVLPFKDAAAEMSLNWTLIKRKGNAAQRFLIKANLKEAGMVAKTFDFYEALLVLFPEGLSSQIFLIYVF